MQASITLVDALLKAFEAGRAREAELDALCVDVPADPEGRWSAKDHVAHLGWWRLREARLLEALRTGGELPPSVEDDAQNAVIYAETKDSSASHVKATAQESWDRIMAAVAAYSDGDLHRLHPYATGWQLWETIPGSTYGHVAEHLGFWYMARGELDRAEAAQTWLRDVEYEAFSDPRRRANADYNLGCFYARRGRAEEAMPLLRAALAGAPNLVPHARKDSDLDPIRTDSRLVELLA